MGTKSKRKRSRDEKREGQDSEYLYLLAELYSRIELGESSLIPNGGECLFVYIIQWEARGSLEEMGKSVGRRSE